MKVNAMNNEKEAGIGKGGQREETDGEASRQN